jgi:hypothetical protein
MWRKNKVAASSRQPAADPKRWHAVSIMSAGECCEAARGLLKGRYLSAEAPRLPLAYCSDPTACRCAYRHHTDRRGPPRRREDLIGLKAGAFNGQERRDKPDRRKADEPLFN